MWYTQKYNNVEYRGINMIRKKDNIGLLKKYLNILNPREKEIIKAGLVLKRKLQHEPLLCCWAFLGRLR